MSIGPDFEAILAAAQTGAEWAVAVIYTEHNPLILRYLRSRAPREAEDLAAEVWLAVARHLPRFAGDEAAFRGWVFTIARRQLIGHWRQTGRRRTSPAPVDELADRTAADDTEATVVSSVAADEAVARITALLPPDQAEVVLLRLLGDLSVEQTAAVMGKRPGTVRVLQHRALRRLAEAMSGELVTK